MRLLIAALAVIIFPMAAYADELRATSKIDEVSVYPSTARVTRIAKIKIPKGEHVILIEDLTAQAVPGSIRVQGEATGALEIISVDSRRINVARNDAATLASERKQLEREIETLRDQRAVISAQVRTAQTQMTLISNLAQLPTRPLPPQGTGAAPATDWGAIYGLIGERMSQAQMVMQKARLEQRELDRKIKDLQGKLDQVAPVQKVRTQVKVNVAAGVSLDAQVTIQYQVRRASWTPLYDARLTTGSKTVVPKLTLIRRANITQRSGEAWGDVKLNLSTTRPAAGSAAPELYTQSVNFYAPPPPSPPRPMAMAPAKTRSFKKRRSPGLEQDSALGGIAGSRIASTRIVERRARIRTAAFQAVFTVPGRHTIAQTGELKRVGLGTVTVEPSLLVRSVPKRRAAAFLYAKFKLPKGSPYLPGPVQLFRDATFVGSGRLPLLRPAQDHELGFGRDDSVIVKYAVLEKKRGKTGIISSSKTDLRNYKITVKNLHERAIDLVVLDQIPVSRNQDIRVELIGRSPPSEKNVKDRRGVLAWKMKMSADQEININFGYRITWPSDKRIRYGR